MGDSLSPINTKIKEIKDKKEWNLYYENQYLIPYIDDEITFREVLNVFKSKNDKIELQLINSNISGKFLLDENVSISHYNIGYINKGDIDTFEKFDKLFKKVGENSIGLLNRAVGLKISAEIVKEVIEKNNIKIPEINYYINAYIGNKETINEGSFKNIVDKVIEGGIINNLNDEEKRKLTRYLINNIEEDKNIKAIISLIEKGFYGANAEFTNIPIDDTRISSAIVEKNPSMIMILPKHHLGNKDVVQAFLESGDRDKNGKMTDESKEKKGNLIQYLDLSDINIILQIFDHYSKIQEKSGKNHIMTNIMFSNPVLLSKVTNTIKNKGNMEVNIKYKKRLEEIKPFIKSMNTILYKTEFESSKTNFDKKIKEVEEKKQEISKLTDNISTKLIGKLNENQINSLTKIIKENINNTKITSEKLLIIIVGDLTKNKVENQEEVIKIIIGELNDYNTRKIEKIAKGLSATNISKKFKIEVDGNEKVDNEKINSKFNEFLETRKKDLELLKGDEKEKKIDEFKNEFISINFATSSTEDQKKILEILNVSLNNSKIRIIGSNIPTFLDYAESGITSSFEEYAKENNIHLNKPKVDDIKTNDGISNKNLDYDNSENTLFEYEGYKYSYVSGKIEFDGKNGTEIIPLSVEDKKIINNKENKEALKNLVDFYKTLNELGLGELWKYKNDIFRTISNKIGVGFNIDNDYLNLNEVKIFLNSILKSVGKNTIDLNKNIGEFKNIFSQKNDLQIIGNGFKDKLMSEGSSTISELFLHNFVIGKTFFASSEFSNSLK